jgi:hypothetical protein
MEKSKNSQITDALITLKPNSQWILRGDNYSSLEWLDKEQTQPTLAEIEAEIANPTPKPEPTIDQKLSSVGLSVADLKAALGL